MDSRNRTSNRLPVAPLRALIVAAAWLHVGLVGATTLAAGLLELTDGASRGLSGFAFALVLGGAAVAVTGWRLGLAALERLEPAMDSVPAQAANDPGTGVASRQPAPTSLRAISAPAPFEQEA